MIDSVQMVEALEQACRRGGVSIGYVWEVDCGVGRFGTAPGAATAGLIAQAINIARHASFDGLLAFGGHAYSATCASGIAAAARDEYEATAQTVSALLDRGIDPELRSVGSTPTAHAMEPSDLITEIRPGNYVFYDATQVALGVVPFERCALSVLATVTSRPAANRLILDAGSKALAAERLSALTTGFGVIQDHPDLIVERLYEEQAIVVSAGPSAIPIGARVRVVPNHACAVAKLHSQMLIADDGALIDVWPVGAREWSQYRSLERTGAEA